MAGKILEHPAKRCFWLELSQCGVLKWTKVQKRLDELSKGFSFEIWCLNPKIVGARVCVFVCLCVCAGVCACIRVRVCGLVLAWLDFVRRAARAPLPSTYLQS